jgi:hypothetical protein
MVLVVVASMVSMASSTALSGYADLPNPTANLKTVPSGSLVIPMDLKQYSGGVFNVRAYGTDLAQLAAVSERRLCLLTPTPAHHRSGLLLALCRRTNLLDHRCGQGQGRSRLHCLRPQGTSLSSQDVTTSPSSNMYPHQSI